MTGDLIGGRAVEAILGETWLMQRSALESLLNAAARANIGDGIPKLFEQAQARTEGDTRIIPITGPIFRRANLMTTHCGATSLDAVQSEFSSALADSAVKRIVLEVDSPGGQASGIQSFADSVYAARSTKQIVAHVDNLAASAGYWIASAASEIVMSETASLGSVGVVLTASRQASGFQIVSTQSPKKRMDPTSAEGRTELQKLADSLAEVFVTRVARNRSTSREHVLEHFGQGWIKTGQDAIAAGMADGFGHLQSAGVSGSASSARAEWEGSAELRDEFGSFEVFEAYRRAEAGNLTRRRGSIIGPL